MWLKVPGFKGGLRTLEEQLEALKPALLEAKGKTVLDLGCAEGLIGIEFAKVGAKVLGVDSNAESIEIAKKQSGLVEFRVMSLNEDHEPMPHDIVLALGVVHKLHSPVNGLRFAARSAKELLLLRSGTRVKDGIISSKHSKEKCDSHALMREEGFFLENTLYGPAPRKESVEYWRKT